MTVTISDIAKRAQVSKATISRVLNNKPDVAPETVERVRAAIQELGYVPSAQAVSLARGEASCIGVLVPTLTWPVILDILRGVSEEVENSGYGIMLYTMTSSEEAIRKLMTQAVRAKQIDGLVVLTPPGMVDYIEELHHHGLPAVLIDDRGYNPKFPSVTIDNVAGGYAATQHLLANGRRRIAYINGNQEFGCSQDRLQGYLKALKDAGIEPDADLIYEGDFTEERGAVGMKLFLERGIDVDAVFAANDQMAFGVMKVLRAAGKRIPHDVAVVGFDNIYTAAYTTPSLTTIHQPFYEMGQTAVELLLDRLGGRELPDVPISLPTALVVRESSVVGAPDDRP